MPNLVILLLQIGAILVTARIAGILFRAFGQPQVVGEMIAGIALGPSLFGWLAPHAFVSLFPASSLGELYVLSQIGLLLFMFLVGLEFDPEALRGRGEAAFLTSHVSITAPYLLGAGLALYLYPRLSADNVPFYQFALFMGASMSVTAFPVLARILHERQWHQTRLGSVAIACAAVDDVTAWCLLAYIVALVRASQGAHRPWVTLLGLTVYLVVMVIAGRTVLRGILSRFTRTGRVDDDLLAVILLLLVASAVTTEWLGIHLLFGAFFFGAMLPKSRPFVEALVGRIEALATVLLLPIFFAFTGLRTSIGLIHGSAMWVFFLLVVFVAMAGKLAGATVAGRVSGLSWSEASVVGALMNTRGLMELILLNIGLDLGVISPALFSMLVLMAIVTTFMATPLIGWIAPAGLSAGRTPLADPASQPG
ncbi:MAG TPA: cation:proton antiporter [Vicinamibacterales bacterium]|nr:cation:proton antiporter [Vicinamibacterales bacterium]